ncbi:MAG: DUF1292 domain-containing protein [Oscillospiraceae bacterium]|nr:DUF1292 domain-containing protein [Oscillospiraceae bacterium]
MEELEKITLELEEGGSIECLIEGVFDYKGEEYIVLLPQDGTEDVYLYGYKELENDEFELVDIEDDDLFGELAAYYEQVLSVPDGATE